MSAVSDWLDQAKRRVEDPFTGDVGGKFLDRVKKPPLMGRLEDRTKDFTEAIQSVAPNAFTGATLDETKRIAEEKFPFLDVLSDISPIHSTYESIQEGKKPEPTRPGQRPFNEADYPGFDNSAIAQNMQREIASGAAQRRQQQLAQLNKLGVRGADSTAAMGRISSDTERTMQAIRANLARENYLDKIRQWERGQDMDWRQYEQDWKQWQARQQAAQEKAASSKQMIGNVVGMIYGGKKGK